VRARAIGHAQARAEVVRVLHAVEDQDERRLVQAFEHVLDELRHLHVFRLRHHALVPRAPGHAVEALRVDRMMRTLRRFASSRRSFARLSARSAST
jgi:hypothetical protein